MAEYWVDPTTDPTTGDGSPGNPWGTMRQAAGVMADEVNTIYCLPGDDNLLGSIHVHRLAGTVTIKQAPTNDVDTRLVDPVNRAKGYTIIQGTDNAWRLYATSGEPANHVTFENIYFKSNPLATPDTNMGDIGRFSSLTAAHQYPIVFDGCAFIADSASTMRFFKHANTNTDTLNDVTFVNCIFTGQYQASGWSDVLHHTLGKYHFVNCIFNLSSGAHVIYSLHDIGSQEQHIYNSIYINENNSRITYRANNISHCLYQGENFQPNTTTAVTAMTQADFDTMFPNWAAGDYRVAADHVSLQDLGADRTTEGAGIAHDIIGTARPLGAAWDIGPEEYIDPAQPVDPNNKITCPGGISDPLSLFDGLAAGAVVSWTTPTTGIVADVTVDANGYPIFSNSDGWGEATFQFNYETSDGAGDWTEATDYTADIRERRHIGEIAQAGDLKFYARYPDGVLP